MRKYYAERRDKILEEKRKYYAENQDKVKDRTRKYGSENREKINVRRRKNRAENGEMVRELDRKRYAKGGYKKRERERKYYAEKPEIRKGRGKRYRAENREKIRDRGKKYGNSHFRRAEKLGNYSERFNRKSIFERDGWKCAYCKKKVTINTAVLEHKIPIVKGGSHTPANCTTSCAKCNTDKSDKLLNGMQITIFDKVKN